MNKRTTFRARTVTDQPAPTITPPEEALTEESRHYYNNQMASSSSQAQTNRSSRSQLNTNKQQPATSSIKSLLTRMTVTANNSNTSHATLLTESVSEKVLHSGYISVAQNNSNKENLNQQEMLLLQEGSDSRSEVNSMLMERCRTYEKELMGCQEIIQQQNSEAQRLRVEVDQLRGMLDSRTLENSRLKQLYESKAGQVQEVTHEITSRIEKEQTEKNVFIKELNNKNIEINKLRESYSVVKSENDTLNLFIKEKQSEIEQFKAQLEDVGCQKDKIEKYELALSESSAILRDIETRMIEMEKQGKAKDKVIDENNTKITGFLGKMRAYEEKVSELEGIMATMEQQKLHWKVSAEEKQDEAEQWKNSYLSANRKLEAQASLEIKLKNSLATNEDLEVRIAELLKANEILQVQANNQSMKQRRLQDAEAALLAVNRALKEKDQQTSLVRERLQILETQLRKANSNQQALLQAQRTIEQRTKQLKSAERKLQQRGIIVANQERELRRMQDENDKLKDRSDKIDQIYKENKKLTGTLMQKINQIQELQHSVNALESRLASLSNQNMKLEAMFEQARDSAAEASNNWQEAKLRIQYQINIKLQMQETIDKTLVELNQARRGAEKEKESFRGEKEAMKRELESLVSQLTQEQNRFEDYRNDTQTHIAQQRRRVEELGAEVREVKRKIEQHQKKEREQQESIALLEVGKRKMMEEYSALRSTYEQSVAKVSSMEKWRTAFLRFSEGLGREVQAMQDTVQQLSQ